MLPSRVDTQESCGRVSCHPLGPSREPSWLHDPEDGRRLGHGRDLLNMLLMNFSEKRPGDDLTGKFGLGFKSVHVLSDSVGIASGFITLRTAGGFLPKPWPRRDDTWLNSTSHSNGAERQP